MFRILNRLTVVYLVVFFGVSPVVTAHAGPGQALGGRRDSGDTILRGIRSFSSPQKTVDDEQMAIPVGSLDPMGSGSTSSLYYSIHILGEVNRPGTYKIRPSDRVSDALQYAGGLLSNGSTRTIQLRRQGSTTTLDLFAYKYRGLLSQNPYLMENDVVFIPVKRGEIQIEGPVNRPGNYEITKNITLKEAISMAGDFSTGLSHSEPIRIIRYNGEGKREVIEIENSPNNASDFKVQKGDVVVVPHILIADKKFDYNLTRIPGDNIFYPTSNDNVYVIGAVSMPGPYPFQASYGYQDYVSIAGPTNLANTKHSKLITAAGKKTMIKKNTEINPGDTIIVTNKALTGANVVQWFTTLTSMALTTFIFVDRF